jgi:hypothetical protein
LNIGSICTQEKNILSDLVHLYMQKLQTRELTYTCRNYRLENSPIPIASASILDNSALQKMAKKNTISGGQLMEGPSRGWCCLDSADVAVIFTFLLLSRASSTTSYLAMFFSVLSSTSLLSHLEARQTPNDLSICHHQRNMAGAVIIMEKIALF